jgi:hypothetical protein
VQFVRCIKHKYPSSIDKKLLGGRMRLFEEYIEPLKEVGIESIARETGVDEYSKKLKLEEHLKLLVYSIVEDCVTLSALCDSLQSGEAEKKGLISISKA